jgi:hypothetical protein
MGDPRLIPDEAAGALSSASEEEAARDLAARYGLEYEVSRWAVQA